MSLFTGPHAHYDKDLALLHQLGLSTVALPHGVETLLGEVRVGTATVTVRCVALPAKFWRFEIAHAAGRLEVFESDSGALVTRWPQVLRRCAGKETR
ncbi:MAG: hypothetical protein FD161_3000 [Limisphaerales bacterium]|nr:MAG: hypothetical protein FD161_3000 [Limisphaerales bacterium]KAG0508113.1 MAG: hypothetical protein E1N63_2707 [Limisphaerales bacterium]TXT53034.1 MAG: hypothetical protein FD140_142 [Limisphaerales bacterium]